MFKTNLTFGQLVKKYWVVVIIPTMFGSMIYADYSHTRAWKAQRKAVAQAVALRQ